MLENLKKQMKQGDALQQAVGRLLMDMAERNPQWAEIISSDLENESMSLKQARDVLYETAKKKKKDNFYSMDNEEAEKLLIDFYKLPENCGTDAQRIQFDFAEIQAKYIDARKHLEAFCKADAAKAKLLAAAMAQTFHNMGAEIERFK